MMIRLILTILLISQIDVGNAFSYFSNENTRPIIGILSQAVPSAWQKPIHTRYIAASYVKYIEASGAQVVPILMNQSIEYYSHLFNSLNGVLLPGGNFTEEYLYVANLFYTWSLKAFDESQKIFPIWGTCLGFEVLLMLTRHSTDILDTCKADDFATDLIFMPEANQSRLLGSSLPSNVRNELLNKPTTANFHDYCMRPENFTADSVLSKFYKMLTISYDLENRTFVSTIESRRYPIFGVQWHPEKNAFEWRVNATSPHSTAAVEVMQYTANFFTAQARQNFNHFDSLQDELKYLIYQYTPEFMGLDESHFQQLYFFYS